MTAIPSLETRMQQANNQFGAAAAASLATALGGSLNAMLDRLGSGYAAWGLSSGTGVLTFPNTGPYTIAVTGTSVTFTTTGRPCLFLLGNDMGAGPATTINGLGTSGQRFYLYRDGSQIAQSEVVAPTTPTMYMGVPAFFDTGAAAGAHTWQLYYSTPSIGFQFNNWFMMGWQI